MDTRWTPDALNSSAQYSVILHPTADIRSVRLGTAVDGIDVSKNISRGTQSSGEVVLTFDWNSEFLGDNQPRYGWVVEIRAKAQVLWIGITENLSSYVVQTGQRQFMLTARSRQNFDIWKLVKIVTSLYPVLTNLSQIINDICLKIGMHQDEILVPPGAFSTPHTNTQLANVSAWDACVTIFQSTGQEPHINALGQMKGVTRDTQNMTPNITITAERLISVNANQQVPPVTRVIVNWTDPNLTKVTQLPRKLAETTMTSGFFLPFLKKSMWFSSDKTQRAKDTYMIVRQSANALYIPVCLENYSQTSETEGEIEIISLGYTQAIVALALYVQFTGTLPPGISTLPGVPDIPAGSILQAEASSALFLVMMAIGTGIYEIWGTPYDVVHAKNISEAFDINSVPWADNPKAISNDFIANEAMADQLAVRELYFQANAANTWQITIADDKRIEKGDCLALPDGTTMYVSEFTRSLTPNSSQVLQVKGFLV